VFVCSDSTSAPAAINTTKSAGEGFRTVLISLHFAVLCSAALNLPWSSLNHTVLTTWSLGGQDDWFEEMLKRIAPGDGSFYGPN
jgi:hypothetical protein